MTEDTFGKLQTNRVSIKKYIQLFKKNREGAESLISPRPQVGKYQKYYYALLKFSGETKNRSYFTALRNFKALSREEYNQELETLRFYWEA